MRRIVESSEGNGDRILKRLDHVLEYSDGFFIKKAVAPTTKERHYLNNLFKKHPEYVQVVIDKTNVCRLTHAYASKRSILHLFKNWSDFHRQALRRAVWSSFIIEHNIHGRFPEGGYSFKGVTWYVDDFSDSFNRPDGVTLTIPHRIKKITCQSYVPRLLTGKVVKDTLKLYLLLATMPRQLTTEEIIARHLLPGGLWPERESQCHSDRRIYPLWSVPITGLDKWNEDLSAIRERKEIPEGYKFGVYPIEMER
jgi:hypothetical protein